nr:reverse transcriptase domain-containing protein [Tanacetum cinerariifolium]
MEAQNRKFLDMIQAVRINVPLFDVLDGMPSYGNFLKELISNKHKIEQIYAAFLSDECSAMIQNKVPPKLEDPESFLIPCNFNKTFSCNALAGLGASINLMLYSLYAKLSLETLKPTKMSEMEEDSKVPVILRRPFLHVADAVVQVKQKQINLRVGTERMIFNINYTMKYSYSNDDSCFSIDVINKILEEDFDALLDEDNNEEMITVSSIDRGNLMDFSKSKGFYKGNIDVKLLEVPKEFLERKQDAKPRLIRWVLLLQQFTIEIKDKNGSENLADDHLSRLENPGLEELKEDTIQDNFPDEHLMVIKQKDTETD